MTALDRLRRSQEREAWSRLGRRAAAALVALLLVAGLGYGLHRDGIARGRALEKRAVFEQALKDNAEKLRLARLHRDTTKKEATAAVTAARTHRDTSRATVANVAPTSDTTLQVADLPPLVLPKLAIDAYRDLLVGRRVDSLAIVRLTADNAALETENALLVDRVDVYERHEQDHAAEVKSAGRRGFRTGLISGAFAALVLGIIAM